MDKKIITSDLVTIIKNVLNQGTFAGISYMQLKQLEQQLNILQPYDDSVKPSVPTPYEIDEVK